MRGVRIWAIGVVAAACLSGQRAEAHGRGSWSVGIGFGGPGCCYRPWGWGCGAPYWYYRPYPVYAPVYVAPAPVYAAPSPVVVQPAPAAATAPPAYQPPPPTPLPVPNGASGDVEYHLQQLASADEQTRLASVQQLGRMRAEKAIDPLAATLAGDRSPSVRDAAARALGLIGSPRALPALQMATYNDGNHDVRHSAQFAVEVIQTHRN